MRRVFKVRHESAIRAAREQCELGCSITVTDVKKGRRKIVRRVVVDGVQSEMGILRLALSDAMPIGGWD